ncbi:autotransporter outer membrane beta-barrel domain-containing protein [Dyella silvatica]|uniref:autotransporter outer membrane beta-barrel domain-containing protein n=1 Tax=Dyella silvatica TaxID=2992128 RepID=UPI002256135B|nr:autotransporter outer membrane beta-barrel domain-containing protein [Dyella silvatica]
MSIFTVLAAATVSKAALATQYDKPITGSTDTDGNYNTRLDAAGNLVYTLASGDSIAVDTAQDNANGVLLDSNSHPTVLQVAADGKGTLDVSAHRNSTDTWGTAYGVDVEAGGRLTVNGATSVHAQADAAVHWVTDHNEGGSGAQGVRVLQGTATFNGDLAVDVSTPAYSQGLWIYQGNLTVNGKTTIVSKGRGANTAGIYNSGGGRGNVVFNGDVDVTGYGIWPSDNVHGIYNDNLNTKLAINGDATITATSNGSTVMGVRNQGNLAIAGNATVTATGPRSAFGIDNTHRTSRFYVGGDLTVSVTNGTGYTPFGLPTALSNMYGLGSSMTLAGALDARVTGVTESYAINNSGVMSFTSVVKPIVLRANVNCSACDGYGIANNGGSIRMAGGLDVAVTNNGSGHRYAIWNAAVDGQNALLDVDPLGGSLIDVDGDVVTRNLTNASNTLYTGTTRLNFDGGSSFLKGLVLGGAGNAGTATYSAGIPVLSFANGARWIPAGSGTLDTDFGKGSLTIGASGVIDLAASWGAFAPDSVPAHSFRTLHIDSSTGGASVNLADGASFTLLSDIRHAQADKVILGSGIGSFATQGIQKVRIAYDPVLDDTSWVNALTLKNGTAIAAAQPIAIVDVSAAARGTAAFQAAAGLAGQWSTAYENALVRFSYVPRVQTSADSKQIWLTGIDILGAASNTGGSAPPPASSGSGSPGATAPSSNGNTGTDTQTGSLGGVTPTPIVPSAGRLAIAPSTGVLVAGDAALAMSNLWQVDEHAISRRSEALRAGDTPGESTCWADVDGGHLKGDGSNGRSYRQNVASASAGTEWSADFDDGRRTVGLIYTHTQSRADLQNGAADLRGNAVGLYGIWNAAHGMFVDAVARVGRLSDSYTARDALGMASGSYHARAASVTVRTGQRFQGERGGYIEPQVQAAYGSIGRSAYSASNRVRVDVHSNSMFLARAGVLFGKTLFLSPALAGDVYARVSVVHMVGDRPDVTASLDGGSVPVVLPTRHATTGEAIAGMRIAIAESWSAFAEAGRVSRTDAMAGGWLASAGFRVSF